MTTDLSSANTGTVRTAVNAGVTAVVVWGVQEVTDTTIDTTNPLFIGGVIFAVGVGYRASRELADRFPVFGRILFGIDAPPVYVEEA